MSDELQPISLPPGALPETCSAAVSSSAGKMTFFESESEGAGGGYHLEPIPAAVAPSGRLYLRPYREYEHIYGKKERTIIWWIKQGRERETPDLPPLDEPEKMPAWWARVMRQRCPEVVLKAAQGGVPSRAAPSGVQPQPGRKASPPAAVSALSGFEDNLRNIREQVALAYAALKELQEAPEPDVIKIELAQRHWMKLDAAAQAAEAKAPDILEKMGRLVDREQLAQELGPMLGAVANSIRSMRRRLKPQLLKASNEAEEDAIWQRGIDEAFEDLRKAGYEPVFLLAA